MKIPLDQFRWYAAFHDESHHPHIHMVCYIADGKSGFLDKEGIVRIKSGLAKEIFRQDLTEIYRRQTERRDAFTQESRDVLRQLIEQMREEVLRTYKDDLPEHLPLSRQKEFKRIRNMVIEEAVRLGQEAAVLSPEDAPEEQIPLGNAQGPEESASDSELLEVHGEAWKCRMFLMMSVRSTAFPF